MLELLEGYRNKNFKITKLKRVDNTVSGIILYNNVRIHIDYMDHSIRKFTNILSLDLRDFYDKNVYYDIIDGEIVFQV